MNKIIFVVCALMLSGGNFFLFAQNNNAASVAAPEVSGQSSEISYGTFVKASPTDIVLSEYDAEQDANVNVVYSFGTDTKLTNAVSVDKITPGADIEVSYSVVNGKKTAKNLVVELPEVAGAKNE
jgi:hypothetical protein